MSKVQEFKTEKGHKISDLINPQAKAKIIQIYKPKKTLKPIPYLIRNIENEFGFNLFEQKSYQKFKTKTLIRIWNQLKQIKVKGKKSILFDKAKKSFLDFISKKSKFQKFDEKIFVYKYFFIAILEIKPKTLVTLYEDNGQIIKTTENRKTLYWTEEDLENHLIQNFQYSRL